MITPSWDKYVLLELVFLLLLLFSNLLLLVGAARSRPDELLPWLALHTLALFLQAKIKTKTNTKTNTKTGENFQEKSVQVYTLDLFLQAFFVIYLIVSISLVALPATQVSNKLVFDLHS